MNNNVTGKILSAPPELLLKWLGEYAAKRRWSIEAQRTDEHESRLLVSTPSILRAKLRLAIESSAPGSKVSSQVLVPRLVKGLSLGIAILFCLVLGLVNFEVLDIFSEKGLDIVFARGFQYAPLSTLQLLMPLLVTILVYAVFVFVYRLVRNSYQRLESRFWEDVEKEGLVLKEVQERRGEPILGIYSNLVVGFLPSLVLFVHAYLITRHVILLFLIGVTLALAFMNVATKVAMALPYGDYKSQVVRLIARNNGYFLAVMFLWLLLLFNHQMVVAVYYGSSEGNNLQSLAANLQKSGSSIIPPLTPGYLKVKTLWEGNIRVVQDFAINRAVETESGQLSELTDFEEKRSSWYFFYNVLISQEYIAGLMRAYPWLLAPIVAIVFLLLGDTILAWYRFWRSPSKFRGFLAEAASLRKTPGAPAEKYNAQGPSLNPYITGIYVLGIICALTGCFFAAIAIIYAVSGTDVVPRSLAVPFSWLQTSSFILTGTPSIGTAFLLAISSFPVLVLCTDIRAITSRVFRSLAKATRSGC